MTFTSPTKFHSNSPFELSHFGIYVSDLKKMSDFFTRVFGFVVTDKGSVNDGDCVFLSLDAKEHHQIILVSGRAEDVPRKALNHFGFRVHTFKRLREIHDALQKEPDVTEIRPMSHGSSWSVYFRDPDANKFEIFVDAPWYVSQPFMEKLDFSLSDDEIVRRSEEKHRDDPNYQSWDQWYGALAESIEAQNL